MLYKKKLVKLLPVHKINDKMATGSRKNYGLIYDVNNILKFCLFVCVCVP